MKSSPTATREYPPQVPVSCECYLIWKKGPLWECDYVTDSERKMSFWIIPIGPECHHKRPYKREKREILDRRGEEIVTQRIRQSEDRDYDITTDQKAGAPTKSWNGQGTDSSL